MTLGEQFIKDCCCKELSYEDAIEVSKKQLLELENMYNDDKIANNPIYPSNAELYDEFVEPYGFDVIEYCAFIRRQIENN